MQWWRSVLAKVTMNTRFSLIFMLAVLACGLMPVARSQEGEIARKVPTGPVKSELFHTEYVRLGSNNAEGLLYEPVNPGQKARIAVVYSFPSENNFNSPPGRELAKRGYRVLMVNYHGADVGPEVYAPSISHGIEYLRGLPGVERVVIIGHSGGGHLVTFYTDVAENGPAACQGQQLIYPCRGEGLKGLSKVDGLILLDPALGAFHRMSSMDPAVNETDRKRDAAVDMFLPANGYDPTAKRGAYSPEFAKRFYAAQAARNDRVVKRALERLHAIEQGTSQFSDDEPFVVPGMSSHPPGARLYQPDVAIVAHTKKPYTLLKADGSQVDIVLQSVRPPTGGAFAEELNSLNIMSENVTVRKFLANDAIRTLPSYGITADDIRGVEWDSSMNSTPGDARGVTVSALVMVMTCHYLVVPGEIIFDHLGSKDKTLVGVEGALHEFNACKPEYGDTVKRTFDYVDSWLSKPGRF
jgi:pimeloyl-ACP methyl ester carboxylesterase